MRLPCLWGRLMTEMFLEDSAAARSLLPARPWAPVLHLRLHLSYSLSAAGDPAP